MATRGGARPHGFARIGGSDDQPERWFRNACSTGEHAGGVRAVRGANDATQNIGADIGNDIGEMGAFRITTSHERTADMRTIIIGTAHTGRRMPGRAAHTSSR